MSDNFSLYFMCIVITRSWWRCSMILVPSTTLPMVTSPTPCREQPLLIDTHYHSGNRWVQSIASFVSCIWNLGSGTYFLQHFLVWCLFEGGVYSRYSLVLRVTLASSCSIIKLVVVPFWIVWISNFRHLIWSCTSINSEKCRLV